jgi:pyrimidine-nucleoside phosphorylase
MRMLDLILKKRQGQEHDYKELEFIAKGAAKGTINDYHLSAWLMACFFNPLSPKEMAALTKAMAFTGSRLEFPGMKNVIDKHSTGGVGDGISLALAPLVASAGVPVPMMSGRGLGFTGGTLDKLEAMKGFKIGLPKRQILRQMKEIGVCMFGQTGDLAPADKKLYALRDATATVESIPLIVASILSKKYAEGVDALVLDVKYGSGSFLIDYDKSKRLAVSLCKTANLLGIKNVALLTAMEEPLGKAVGNALEVKQSIDILKGDNSVPDFKEVLLELGAWMVYLGKKAKSVNEAKKILQENIYNGKALTKMKEMIKRQGAKPELVDMPDRFLPKAKFSFEYRAKKSGFVCALDARTIGFSCVLLGGGRNKMDDVIDYGAGIMLEKKLGDKVKKGETIARLYADNKQKLSLGKDKFETAVKIGSKKPKLPKLIKETIK